MCEYEIITKLSVSLAWWSIPVIPALGKQSQEDCHTLKASLGDPVNSRLAYSMKLSLLKKKLGS